jgi:hypothetical protein
LTPSWVDEFEFLAEQSAICAVVAEVHVRLYQKYVTSDFDIGLNDGPMAAQTVPTLTPM